MFWAKAVPDMQYANATEQWLALPSYLGRAPCQIAVGVQLLMPTHPIDPCPRRACSEAAEPITLGDNVWLGGRRDRLPRRDDLRGHVVGAGAVVTRDLPAGVVAVGNPAQVLREIGEFDRVQMPRLP